VRHAQLRVHASFKNASTNLPLPTLFFAGSDSCFHKNYEGI
jgi:hypothetical protein